MSKKRKKKSGKPRKTAPPESAPAVEVDGSVIEPDEALVGDSGSPWLPAWARWAAFLSLVGLHGFLLAAVANPSPHSGGDNAGYLTLAYSLLDTGQYLDLHDPVQPAHVKYPPVYASVLATAMAFGARTWVAFKSVSGLAILASVALAAGWAWRRRGWSFGLTIGALLAFAGTFLYYSQWILSDPIFLVFTTGALLAFDRVDSLMRPRPPDQAGDPVLTGKERGWLLLGGIATILAFFTRSAGLPLVVAVLLWLALKRQRRALAIFAIAFGVPAVLWWLRSRALGGPGYTGEFWLVNPYQPDLGQVGFVGLVDRFVANFWFYVATEIPAGLLGVRNVAATIGGLLLFVLATVGWIKRLRFVGVAELFVPLYFGLILLWPEVWSGDRFALPLFAPILFYAGETVVRVTRPLHRLAPLGVGTVIVVALLIPAMGNWRGAARQASICRERVEAGPFACYQSRMQEFVAAAQWVGTNSPDGTVVFSRKPRTFYLLSGVPSAVFPFSDDPQVLADAADDIGARYVVVDYLDNVSAFYLVPILRDRPGMFCTVRGFGGDDRGIQTQLLGIRTSVGANPDVSRTDDGAMRVQLSSCAQDGEGFPSGPEVEPTQSVPSGVIPLLQSLDS